MSTKEGTDRSNDRLIDMTTNTECRQRQMEGQTDRHRDRRTDRDRWYDK